MNSGFPSYSCFFLTFVKFEYSHKSESIKQKFSQTKTRRQRYATQKYHRSAQRPLTATLKAAIDHKSLFLMGLKRIKAKEGEADGCWRLQLIESVLMRSFSSQDRSNPSATEFSTTQVQLFRVSK